MDHSQLEAQGIDDIIDGNESYAARYMQGIFYSHDAISLSHVNGSEGFMQTIWEKIKQFCAWIVGLFSGKKETGTATKEIGVKTSAPKATKKEIKVSPVPAKKINPAKPAPKAKEPTEEQQKSDRVVMKVDDFAEQLDRGYQELKKEAAEHAAKQKEVVLVTKTHNLEHLWGDLIHLNKTFDRDFSAVVEWYRTTHKMFGELKGVPEGILKQIKLESVEKFEERWAKVRKILGKFDKMPSSFESYTESVLNSFATSDITSLCHDFEVNIESHRVLDFEIRADKTKERVLEHFKKLIEVIKDEREQAEFSKVLIRAAQLDYKVWALYDISDIASKIKEDILEGKYFVRVPKD